MKLAAFFACALAMLLSLHAENAEELIQKGDALDVALKNREALAVFIEADKLQPNDSRILQRLSRENFLLMADASSTKEKTLLVKTALDYAKRSVAADPQNAKAHFALAVSYGRLAELESPKQRLEYAKKIESEAQIAVKLNPDDDYAWHILGRWNYEIANLNRVLAFFAEHVYGKLPEASNAKAVEYFKKAIALNSSRLIHHAELGRTYAAMGYKDLARNELEIALGMPSKEKDDDETKRRARDTLSKL